nr:MAG TPA: hypothetical protein [Caudoviricetes sp.]
MKFSGFLQKSFWLSWQPEDSRTGQIRKNTVRK